MPSKVFSAIMAVIVLGGIAWGVFQDWSRVTRVTIDVALNGSRTDVTDLVEVEAFYTYFPEAGESGPRFENYGPIFPVEGEHNVFDIEGTDAVGFRVRAIGPEESPFGFQLGGSNNTRRQTVYVGGGIVRLQVVADGPPEVFVQAASDPSEGDLEAYSQGVPSDGEMIFLLPEGDWTFSAVDDGDAEPAVVSVVRGEILDATLDLRDN